MGWLAVQVALDTKIIEILRIMNDIQEHSAPVIERCYREFLLQNRGLNWRAAAVSVLPVAAAPATDTLAAMDRIWLEAPLPALGVRAAGEGVAVRANDAARRWAYSAGIAEQVLQALGASAWAGRVAAGPLRLGELTVHGVPLPHGDGLVLWLQPPQEAADERKTATMTTASALHVVCVEDNPVNLQLVRELIALRPEVRLRTAVDGLSGVQTVLAEPPDLLLLDLQLPDIGGLEVMRRVRAHSSTAACRIVALSADAMPGHIEAALAAGFDDYWTKPIQFDAFLGHIDRLTAERRAA